MFGPREPWAKACLHVTWIREERNKGGSDAELASGENQEFVSGYPNKST